MGFFSKKDRVYPLTEAMRLLKTAKYANYTTIPVGNGYKLVPEGEASKHVEQLKVQKGKIERQNFLNEMSGNGMYKNNAYQNINIKPNYNDYQSARGYKKQNGMNEIYR